MANAYDIEEEVPGLKEEEVVEKQEPLYRVYKGSRIAVGKGTGKMWKQRLDAALVAYGDVYKAWEEAYRYYNNSQTKTVVGPRGVFNRGDSTENIVYSNTNVVIPAVYSKNPDIEVTTDDAEDEPLCDTLKKVLNVLFRRRDKLAAKSKIKKMVGFASLTNMGVLKLDFVMKDDSREMALTEIAELSKELEEASDIKETEEVMGKIQALEQQMSLRDPMGPKLFNVLPHNLIIDPYAELDDGTDASWMIERVWLQTEALKARFTQKDEDGREVLAFKPTHEVMLTRTDGSRDEGLSMVLKSIGEDRNVPESASSDERAAFIDKYYTECYYAWDIVTRRLLLFLSSDWTWPVWVWDDPLKLTRFYPYFVNSFSFSTGGTTSVGEVNYYLDQQDEINDINRKVRQIRRAIFDYWFFNSSKVQEDQVVQFVDTIYGKSKAGKKFIGVDAGEGKISDMIQAFIPNMAGAEAFFNKGPSLEAINRVSTANEGLRGVQFKTNTTEDAVQTYQDALRLSVGAKVDTLEDTVGALAEGLAELCVQHYTNEDIALLVGASAAETWRTMSVPEFRSIINVNIVAGSLEKPNSIFKKKEAVEVAQAVGQFAKAAPGTALMIILDMLQNAFTEINIKPEHWQALQQEIQANLQRGNSQPGEDAAKQLPDVVKQQVVQMKQQGASDEEIRQFVVSQIKEQGNA